MSGLKKGAGLLDRLVATGAKRVCVRRLGGDRAGEIRFTRLFRNKSVTLEAMIQAAFARTQAACVGRDILAVQDTTVTRSSGVLSSTDAIGIAIKPITST